MSTASLAPDIPFQAEKTTTNSLNPMLMYDPVSSEKSHARYALMWKIAAVASAVAFITLAVGAVTLAAIYAEAYLPVATLLAFYPGMPLSLVPIRSCWHKATVNLQEAKIAHDVTAKMNTLTESAMHNLVSPLVQPGVEASKLKSIFAQYLVLLDRKKECLDKINEILLDDNVSVKVGKETLKQSDYFIGNVDFSNEKELARFEMTQITYRHVQETVQKAAQYSMQAANCLRLMARPYEQSDISAFVTILDVPLDLRNQAYSCGDSSWDVYAKTMTRNYSFGKIAKMQPVELAKEIFHIGSQA